MMDASLDGKVVVITGAARGIGAAAAREFAEHGAKVCVADLDTTAAHAVAESIGAPTFAHHVDVTSGRSVEGLVAAVARRFGDIDVMVANAGIMPTGQVTNTDLAIDRVAMEVNHFGVVRCVQAVLPTMIGRNRGSAVVVASLAGRLPIAGLAAYVASKHAVVGWSASLREELVATNVSVSTVLPTAVHTRLSAGIPTHGLAAVSPTDVARTIIRASTSGPGEFVVPNWLDTPSRVEGLLPSVLRGVGRKLLGARRLLSTDRASRQQYEHAIVQQANRVVHT